MADETTQRIKILLDLEQEAHDRAAKKSAREIARLEKAYDPLSRATIKYQQESQKLAAGLEKGTISAKRHAELMDRVQQEYDQTTAKLKRLNTVQAANVNTQSGMVGVLQRNKNAFQQLGYQVGDAAVQIQGGTSAITALTQQGSQMLGVFGAWGAIAGAVLAVGAPLAASFFDQAEGAEDASKALEGFSESLDRYQGFAAVAMASTRDLRDEFGEYADDVRKFSRFMAQVEAGQALTALNDTDLMAGLGPALAAAEDYAAAFELARDAAEEQGRSFDAAHPVLSGLEGIATDAAAEFGLTVDQVKALGPLVRKLKQADTMEGVADAAGEILDLMQSIYGESIAIPKEIAEFMRRMEEARNRAANAHTIMEDIADTADGISTTDIGKGIREATADARDLARQLGISLERAQEMMNLGGGRGGDPRALGGSFFDWQNPGAMGRFEGQQSALDLIRSKEGYRATPYWDVNHYRAGYGSDTTTTASGEVLTVTKGMQVSIADAERDLRRRVETYFDKIVAQIGEDRFNNLDASQKGALASLLHNYGAGEFRDGGDLSGVLRAVRSSNDAVTAQEIARLGSHNGGINEARRREEASAFGDASAIYAAQSAEARAAAEAAREAEAAERDRARALEQSQSAWDRLQASQKDAVAAEQAYAEALRITDEALKNGQTTPELAMAARAQALEDYQQRLAEIQEEAARTPEEETGIKRLQSQYESLTSTLIRAAQAGENVGQALLGWLANSLITAGIQNISSALADMTSQANAAGGGGNIWGTLFGALLGGGSPTPNANGNAFAGGRVTPFADGGVVDGPTLFPMAGSKTGLMGEAGPEAIMPLKRINGKLGVASTGGGGQTVVNQPITIDARGAVEGTAKQIAREIEKRRPQFAQDAVKATYAANRERPLR